MTNCIIQAPEKMIPSDMHQKSRVKPLGNTSGTINRPKPEDHIYSTTFCTTFEGNNSKVHKQGMAVY